MMGAQTHELNQVGNDVVRCTCGVVGEQNEMAAHLAAVTREEADWIVSKAWTLVCAAEERPYTAEEIERIITSSTTAFAKFTKLLEVTASSDTMLSMQERMDALDEETRRCMCFDERCGKCFARQQSMVKLQAEAEIDREIQRQAELSRDMAKRPNKVDKHRIDHSDFVRAGGDVTCKVCGHVYYDHPVVVGYEWLRRACDGRLLKL